MRERIQSDERTSFQDAGPFDPRIDSRADVAMVYGMNDTFKSRLSAWRDAGYRPHVMVGISWGGYQAYVRGEWDGVQHYDDAQTATNDFRLEHGVGYGHDCFYMMPSRDYARYLAEQMKPVIDAGAIAIHFEEPEFWVSAGYSEGFKREWREFFGEDWQDPISSPDAQYRASRLKQHLYTRTCEYLFTELKAYAAEKGVLDFRCYIPTHSLLSYAHWNIVSPESEVVSLRGCDGLIGQVWTGTSRTPTVYRGARRQRTMETGYCEYAACAALVRGTDKRLWQLADPIEDDLSYSWDDYRTNWECTVTGSLLVEESERFEITPWPSRVFNGTYPTKNLADISLDSLVPSYLACKEQENPETAINYRRALDTMKGYWDGDASEMVFSDIHGMLSRLHTELAKWNDQEDAQKLRDAAANFVLRPTEDRITIPEAYSTELQVVFNALADMYWPGDTEWIHGTTGVGLGISDTLMFQRGGPDASDSDLSSVYGLATPLVKHGVALHMVQLERIVEPGYLDGTRILVLTYEGQKPKSSDIHEAIVKWVEDGGFLFLFGVGDGYDTVREWWNSDGADFTRPQEHLFRSFRLPREPKPGTYTHGHGSVIINPMSPAEIAHNPNGADIVVNQLRRIDPDLALGNLLALRRGPYLVAAAMDESTDDAQVIPGTFVNLYNSDLAIRENPAITPGSHWLLYDIARCPDHPWVIAAAGCVKSETYTADTLTFTVEGIADTTCAVRVRIDSEPKSITVDGMTVEGSWYEDTRTALIRFPNKPKGVDVQVSW
jgi:hypothetical protein